MLKLKSLLPALFIFFCSANLFSQPVTEAEQNENLTALIGNYKISYIYNGFNDEWRPLTKRTFTYKENMKPLEYIQQKSMGDNWSNSSKYIYAYNSNDSLACLTEMEGNLNDFYNSRLTSLLYDEQGNITERLTENWYSDAWENHSKFTYEYNSMRNLTLLFYQTWDGSEWINTQKTIFTYLNDTLLSEQLIQNWADSIWTNVQKVKFEYDNNGNLKEQKTSLWDSVDWADNNRETREYNDKGNLAEVVYDTWNSENWENTGKNLYTYNDKDLVVEIVNMQWSDGAWIPNVRVNIDYNDNDRQVYIVRKMWQNQDWQNYSQSFYQYENNEWLNEFRKQFWSDGNWSNDKLIVYDYNRTGVDENDKSFCSNLTGSPNPFRETTTISYYVEVPGYSEINIYDQLGNFVMSLDKGWKAQGSRNIVFDASSLTQGVYYCKIQIGKIVLTEKLLMIK